MLDLHRALGPSPVLAPSTPPKPDNKTVLKEKKKRMKWNNKYTNNEMPIINTAICRLEKLTVMTFNKGCNLNLNLVFMIPIPTIYLKKVFFIQID